MDYLPLIEDSVPLPASVAEAMPRLTPGEEIAMRARTIKLLSDLTGVGVAPTQQDACEAMRIAEDMTKNPATKRDFSQYPNEVMAYLAGMVQESNMQLVEELSELKMYVVNKLIFEVEHAKDSKNRIAALSKLGEIDGIDAFKKRSTVEHTYKTVEEVENALSSILDGIEYEEVEPVKPEKQRILEKLAENRLENSVLEPLRENQARVDVTVGGENSP